MLNVPKLIFVCILLAGCVVTNLNKRVKAGKRNRSFDNRHKTDNELRQFTNTNAFSCLALCSDDIDCRSVAYNFIDGRCQEFNRDFTNQPVAGIYQVGWRHFDVAKGAACKDRPPTARDCDDVQSQGYTCSGVYSISLVTGRSVNVLCDLQTAGGRWTVFQHRKDGSVNFDMNWSSYKNGFGNPDTEGNDKLYRLTSSRKTELLILMEAWDGVWKYASYSEFYINPESDKYRLRVSGFSGTAGDSLMHTMSFTSPQGGQQFSTRDSDNDAWPGSCNPTYHKGGFWFNKCGASDLNGHYYSSAVDLPDSCNWYTFSKNRQSLKTIFMMVRKV
ncbi:Ryncolin-2,Angiopoietin-related protein 6,Ryncolin-1,Fibroleukin,Ficolin-1,Ficolin-1-B [Mytilus edulis]|uniref:Ryncolin-2,Angiopoietin-related protein 6,Ryncolin-1,Fibroleukin,Ficolin-1,Ficolin-1-B n=1 Tax=Mytilus edulis TaxID=6550 RepID=A0A8S3VJH9_MYTED|nr:Ryncolin-2,Angiopoietin-related protein 6,Ryncolin-1,Fibroleukin,Ficolin-1,Ficolin-1-B [Mytilus edulis]